ncbi:MAG: RecX family transcriptional regulator [Pseudomonadota bacterium]|nr:RecX family transcriptional regulator [Pseudomonadota bacterium]
MKKLLPPNLTPERLARAAVDYLGRYAASEASLRRVLANRLRRAAMRDPGFAADQKKIAMLRDAIENIVERHKKSGALNDLAFAETKINSLRRAGKSSRAITQKLGYAGVGKDMIKQALEGNEAGLDAEEAEIKAAYTCAKRRKLGPFRAKGLAGIGKKQIKEGADAARNRKELAFMARAGFPLALARRVLGSHLETEDEGGTVWEDDGFSEK